MTNDRALAFAAVAKGLRTRFCDDAETLAGTVMVEIHVKKSRTLDGMRISAGFMPAAASLQGSSIAGTALFCCSNALFCTPVG